MIWYFDSTFTVILIWGDPHFVGGERHMFASLRMRSDRRLGLRLLPAAGYPTRKSWPRTGSWIVGYVLGHVLGRVLGPSPSNPGATIGWCDRNQAAVGFEGRAGPSQAKPGRDLSRAIWKAKAPPLQPLSGISPPPQLHFTPGFKTWKKEDEKGWMSLNDWQVDSGRVKNSQVRKKASFWKGVSNFPER